MRTIFTAAVAAAVLATGAVQPAMAYPAASGVYRMDVQYRTGCYRGERAYECRERLRAERRYGRQYRYDNGRYYNERNNNDSGAALAAGILGFALGAAILGSQSDRTYYNTRRTDRSWHNYCRNKFRSYDRSTGTYLGNDGYRHYCR